MANVSRINGFRPVGVNGQYMANRVTEYFIPSTDNTAVYVGDPVQIAGSADTDGRAPTITLATAGAKICGVVVGFRPNPDNLNVTGMYRAASTARYALVADDPNQLFEASASNGTPAVTDIGLNINHAVGSPSTTTATSGAYLDFGTEAATSTLTFTLRGFSSRVDNEVGANAKMIVSVNKHQFAVGGQYDTGATADIGVLGV